VDVELFHPSHRAALNLPGPILLYVGRVSIEKNIEAFLALDTPGTKVIVGDGPIRKSLEEQYPSAVFAGMKKGMELSRYYASADVFVFPGPLDVVGGTNVGVLHEDLNVAISQALQCSRSDCRTFAEQHSWEASARVFAETLIPLKPISSHDESDSDWDIAIIPPPKIYGSADYYPSIQEREDVYTE
jgi:hypothetical protein